MSRAEWFAMGSAVVLGGCSGGEGSPAPNPSSVNSIAPTARVFECGDAQCLSSVEFCYQESTFNACEPYAAARVTPDDGGCGEYPTCACYQTAIGNARVCGCDDDDAGGLTITGCHSHSCYGSPPARLERVEPRLPAWHRGANARA
jgi:hypothetical protein